MGTFFKAVLLRYQTRKSIFFRFFSPKGPPFDFKNLKIQMIASIFDLEKNRNMFWNQGSQLFHLPHETEFFHEIFIFSTSLMYTHIHTHKYTHSHIHTHNTNTSTNYI